MANRQATIGAFVLGGIVLAVGAIVFFSRANLFSPRRQALIIFDRDVSGLSVGAPVTFSGVRVGSVQSITIQYNADTHTGYVPVTVELEPDRVRVVRMGDNLPAGLDLPNLIARGLRAQLVTQSFVTGQAQIGLDFAPGTPAILHPHATDLAEIPTRPSTVERVKEQLSQLPLQELVATVMTAFASARTLLDQLNKDLPQVMASTRAATDGAAQTTTSAAQMISALQDKLGTVLDRVDRLAANADRQIGQRGTELQALLLSTRQTVQQANTALTDMRGLTAPRGETRANLDATLRDLAAAASSLRGAALDVERNPQLLLTGRR